MNVFKLFVFLLLSTSSLQSYSEETITNLEAMSKTWISNKAYLVAEKEIFKKHCDMFGVDFHVFLHEITANSANLFPISWIYQCIEESPHLLRPYTQLERSCLLAYQAGYEECAMLSCDELNNNYESVMKKEKFHQSLFASAFGIVWAKVRCGSPQSILIGACIGIVYEYSKDYAISCIWNPKDQLKALKMLSSRAESAEEHLILNLRPVVN